MDKTERANPFTENKIPALFTIEGCPLNRKREVCQAAILEQSDPPSNTK